MSDLGTRGYGLRWFRNLTAPGSKPGGYPHSDLRDLRLICQNLAMFDC